MEKLKFKVMRAMHGDREYSRGDSRSLSAIDAAPLVRSGALKPSGAEAQAAMEKLLGEPAGNFGVRRVSNRAMDANNLEAARDGASPTPAKSGQAAKGKAAGNAPSNKADVTTPPPGTVNAGEPGVEPVTGEGSGEGVERPSTAAESQTKSEEAPTPPPAPAPAPTPAPKPAAKKPAAKKPAVPQKRR